MGRQNIEKRSKRYAICKAYFKFWHNNIFYRKVIVLGRDNINYDENLIFAPNHQNALMDALAVLFTLKGQPVFLARADIFKKKFFAACLYFLKILPVYRIRDGYSSLKENDQIFEKTIDVVKNKNGLVILPEGNHSGFRRLRQLKKGICRIAFQTDEVTDYKLPIKIIPVGLEYTHYQRYRQVLTVVYGKPISIADYRETYKEKPEIALCQLRDKLAEDMKKIMVHIESEEDYEALNELRTIVNEKYSDSIKFPKLFRDKVLINKLNKLRDTKPDIYKKICELSLYIKKEVEGKKISYRLLRKKKHSWLRLFLGVIGMIATIPIFIYGNIFNGTFLNIPNLSTRKIKDPQFHSSVKYFISAVFAFILTPIFFILSFVIFSPWWVSLIVFFSLPITGFFTWHYYLWIERVIGGFKVLNYKRIGDKSYEELKNKFDELETLISQL